MVLPYQEYVPDSPEIEIQDKRPKLNYNPYSDSPAERTGIYDDRLARFFERIRETKIHIDRCGVPGTDMEHWELAVKIVEAWQATVK